MPMRYSTEMQNGRGVQAWSFKEKSGLEFSLGVTIIELTYKPTVKEKGE